MIKIVITNFSLGTKERDEYYEDVWKLVRRPLPRPDKLVHVIDEGTTKNGLIRNYKVRRAQGGVSIEVMSPTPKQLMALQMP